MVSGGGGQTPAPTSISLTAFPGTALQGQPVELRATLTGNALGTSPPSGRVTFHSAQAALGTAAVDPSGVAEFRSTLLPVGSDAISASYGGDPSYAGSASATLQVTINKASTSTYSNPLSLDVSGTQQAVSCADPAIYKQQLNGVDTWYLYCTSDALYTGDTTPHFINVFYSADLVNWTYSGNAFVGLPPWANTAGAALWAPAIKYFNGQYYLYFTTPVTTLAGQGAAIGVGVSASPAGPFVHQPGPVVEPERATNCCGGAYRSTLDPDVITDASGQSYILFGSFTGGIYVRRLSADGFTSDIASEQLIAADSRYEGGNWWFHAGYYYLLASSTNCCSGPLTGYGVFAGRATTPLGPYLDAQGISMTALNVGGTPVLRMNGNSVLGPGGNVMFTDEAGQDYMLYHGIKRSSPYYPGQVGYTARPGYIDAVDWVNEWPEARGGFGPSDQDAPQPLPAAQPGSAASYVTSLANPEVARSPIATMSDEFSSPVLSSQWSFLHESPSYTLMSGTYSVPTVSIDSIGGMASLPLLAESAPPGDFIVETKVQLNLPSAGAGADYAQAGLLLYGDDYNYVRLDLYSKSDTRQIEFVKQETAEAAGYPTWGETSLGPPDGTTPFTAWLRVTKTNVNGEEHYTAYSSQDGSNWFQGGTWVHSLGASLKICLYAGNRGGYVANFDYVHVSTIQ
ncbi:MAG TPA: family 43 glycosylhydrolase [Acidisarcina sp.]